MWAKREKRKKIRKSDDDDDNDDNKLDGATRNDLNVVFAKGVHSFTRILRFKCALCFPTSAMLILMFFRCRTKAVVCSRKMRQIQRQRRRTNGLVFFTISNILFSSLRQTIKSREWLRVRQACARSQLCDIQHRSNFVSSTTKAKFKRSTLVRRRHSIHLFVIFSSSCCFRFYGRLSFFRFVFLLHFARAIFLDGAMNRSKRIISVFPFSFLSVEQKCNTFVVFHCSADDLFHVV